MDKIIKLGIILGILLIGFPFFYYLVVFIPQREKDRLEFERTKLEQQKQTEATNKVLLQDCLDDVTNRFSSAFKDKNNVPYEEVRIVIDLFQKQKDECFRKYPQN